MRLEKIKQFEMRFSKQYKTNKKKRNDAVRKNQTIRNAI